MKTRYIFLSLNSQDGERSHTHRVLFTTKCESLEFAVTWYILHFWGKGEAVREDGIVEFDCGEIAVEYDFAKEITREEYEFMSNLFYGYVYEPINID